MFTLRCTQKLLRRGLPEPAAVPAPPTTLLGDWYANILFSRPQQLVLCISERSLLPVLVPAKDLQSLSSRVRAMAATVLSELGIDPMDVATESAQMESAQFGRTASRSVLGTLNDFTFELEHALLHFPERSWLDHALWLARTPCKPIEYASPDRATIALFQSSAVLRQAREKRTP